MIETRKTVVRLLMRLVVAALATWYGRYLIVTAETGVVDLSRLLAAMLCFVVAALVFAPQLLSLVTELTGDVVSSGGFGGKCRPFYRLAADKGRGASTLRRLPSLKRSLINILRKCMPIRRCSPLR